MKFKVGDKVRNKKFNDEYIIFEIDDGRYYVDENRYGWIDIEEEHKFELIEDDECCGGCKSEPKETISLNYEAEYYRLLEELETSRLLNDVLLDYIKLYKE